MKKFAAVLLGATAFLSVGAAYAADLVAGLKKVADFEISVICARRASGESRYKAWSIVTKLNEFHGTFFWISLFTVGFADFYIWMVSSGHIHDLRLI